MLVNVRPFNHAVDEANAKEESSQKNKCVIVVIMLKSQVKQA